MIVNTRLVVSLVTLVGFAVAGSAPPVSATELQAPMVRKAVRIAPGPPRRPAGPAFMRVASSSELPPRSHVESPSYLVLGVGF
jgi:hypothetical protein